MPRRRSTLATKTSRADLPPTDVPLWELISPGVRLGYRRGQGTRGRGGTWLAASRLESGRRVQTKLALADDVHPSNGMTILTHDEAKDRARSWVKALRVGISAKPSLTVDDVLDRYLEARTNDGMKSAREAKSRTALHIRPVLGSCKLSELSLERLRTWRDGLVKKPIHRRSGKGKASKTVVVDLQNPESLRKRRDTANRTLTILKAALNWARDNQLVEDDRPWRSLKPFRNTTSARVRFLDTGEQQRLLNAAEGSIRYLVAAALMTGARFGELSRLIVRDFDPANRSVFVAESKSGKARHIPLTDGGHELFRQLSAGRAPTHPLLTRDGVKWTPASYQRGYKEALARAVLESITLHELRHSYASAMVRSGAPLIVVAEALGHSDTRMVEKHYAHLAPSYVADTIRRTAPNLSIGLNNLLPIERRRT